MAMCSTLMAYIVRLAVGPISYHVRLSVDFESTYRSRINPWTSRSPQARFHKSHNTSLLRQTLKTPSALPPLPWTHPPTATMRIATNKRRYLGQGAVDRTLSDREGFLVTSLLTALWTWKVMLSEALPEGIEGPTTAD